MHVAVLLSSILSSSHPNSNILVLIMILLNFLIIKLNLNKFKMKSLIKNHFKWMW